MDPELMQQGPLSDLSRFCHIEFSQKVGAKCAQRFPAKHNHNSVSRTGREPYRFRLPNQGSILKLFAKRTTGET